VKVTDSEWHNVSLSVKSTETSLSVDGLPVTQPTTSGADFSDLQQVTAIQVTDAQYKGQLTPCSPKFLDLIENLWGIDKMSG